MYESKKSVVPEYLLASEFGIYFYHNVQELKQIVGRNLLFT